MGLMSISGQAVSFLSLVVRWGLPDLGAFRAFVFLLYAVLLLIRRFLRLFCCWYSVFPVGAVYSCFGGVRENVISVSGSFEEQGWSYLLYSIYGLAGCMYSLSLSLYTPGYSFLS